MTNNTNNELNNNAIVALTQAIVNSTYAQENPSNRVITQAFITSNNVLWVRSSCDGWAESIKRDKLWAGHPFVKEDFIGLTEAQANKMIDMESVYDMFKDLSCYEEDDLYV